MQERIQRVETKLDTVIDVNRKQDIHLERLTMIATQNAKILDEHMRRTEANEQRIELVEKSIDKHLSFIQGAIWLAGVGVTIVGVIAALEKTGILKF